MKTYGQLNLQAIREAADLDFAHWTYRPGQCSCCYGPIDQPAKYWKNGKKPRRKFLTPDKRMWEYRLNGQPYHNETCRYILFKNANNGRGCVTEDDLIKDNTCISYHLNDMEQLKRICDMLQEQLGDEYVVQCPDNNLTCIIIYTVEGWKERHHEN